MSAVSALLQSCTKAVSCCINAVFTKSIGYQLCTSTYLHCLKAVPKLYHAASMQSILNQLGINYVRLQIYFVSKLCQRCTMYNFVHLLYQHCINTANASNDVHLAISMQCTVNIYFIMTVQSGFIHSKSTRKKEQIRFNFLKING